MYETQRHTITTWYGESRIKFKGIHLWNMQHNSMKQTVRKNLFKLSLKLRLIKSNQKKSLTQ